MARAIEALRALPEPTPLATDEVARWAPARAARALEAAGIKTLAEVAMRAARRRRWWTAVPGLGVAGARQVEACFERHPYLLEQAHAMLAGPGIARFSFSRPDAKQGLATLSRAEEGVQFAVAPWEQLRVPGELDGSQGRFRAPAATCTLGASTDYEAVNAWLSLHESAATQRAYRKEVERLMLWSVIERSRALSSLDTQDAVAYRAFLRSPTPRSRWVGPACGRLSGEWKPFAGGLSARSVAYALSVASAMFRWLVQQRYTLANPFAGIKVRGASREALGPARAFTDGEWRLIRSVADRLEWTARLPKAGQGEEGKEGKKGKEGTGVAWSTAAAQRLRFVLDFAYATGLRNSEIVGARLAQIEDDGTGERWIHVRGKGAKAAKVALPGVARHALDNYLLQRGLPVSPAQWHPQTPLLGDLVQAAAGISSARLWRLMKRFFETVARQIEGQNPVLAEKLRRASPHWMRHTHATHALSRGASLTSVRDNLRHASLQTTSIYLHNDESVRAREMDKAFGTP